MNDKLEIGLKFWQLVGSRLGFLREGKTRGRGSAGCACLSVKNMRMPSPNTPSVENMTIKTNTQLPKADQKRVPRKHVHLTGTISTIFEVLLPYAVLMVSYCCAIVYDNPWYCPPTKG